MDSWKPDLCIYHGNCADGFGAAWAIWKRWPGIEFVAGRYGDELPDVTGKHVLFVDFSAKRADLDAMAQSAKSIVILDHHKTAEVDLAPFIVDVSGRLDGLTDLPNDLPGMLRDIFDLDRPAILAFFDQQSSGAVMAWEFAHGIKRNDPPPTMLSYIQDRDLWRFAYGLTTKRFSAALRTYPQDFKVWDEIANEPETLVAEGVSILRAHEANLEKIVAEAYMSLVGGHSVPIVNAPYHYASDAASLLLAKYPNAPFAACWFRRGDGQIQWSLRSEDHREDVSAVAKAHGGGGHRNAAGFQSLAAPGPINGPT